MGVQGHLRCGIKARPVCRNTRVFQQPLTPSMMRCACASLRSIVLRSAASQKLLSLGLLKSVTVVLVDPAYTSLSCSACGEIGSRRKHKFVCKSCGNSMDADHNGAVNISRRGRQTLRSRNAVNRPEAAVLATDQQAVAL